MPFFTRFQRYWFALSGSLVFSSLVLVGVFHLNLGLDFTGGARWNMDFEKSVEVADLDEFFDTQSLEKQPLIQTSDTGNFLVTIEDMEDARIQAIEKSLTAEFGMFETISYQKVDSSIGREFKERAQNALLFALLGIVIFVMIAFRKVPAHISSFRFSMVTILALFHDILIILGVFVLLGVMFDVELDLPFITALLATLGFSVNDTIVILDRVRENIRIQKPHEEFSDTIEKSIRQTLFRSLYTSISTLCPLLGLLLFGADSIFFFVLALTIGIAVGTYSSIFLAAPLLNEWMRFARQKDDAKASNSK